MDPISTQLALYRGGRPFVLSGPGGTGKTLAAMALGIAYAAGDVEALGGAVKLDASGPVIFYAYEGSRFVRPRLEMVARACGRDLCALLEVGLCFDLNQGPASLDDRSSMEMWCRRLDDKTLVIVDSLRAATPGVSEIDAAKADVLGRFERLSNRSGATFLVVAHEGRERGRPRGTTAIVDAAELVSSLQVDKQGVRTLTCVKSNHRAHDPISFRMVFQGDVLERFEAVDQDAGDLFATAPDQAAGLRPTAQRVLAELGPAPITQRQLALRLSMSGGRVGQALRDLGQRGLAEQRDGKWIASEAKP